MGTSKLRSCLAAVAVTAGATALPPVVEAKPTAGIVYGGKSAAKWPVMVAVSRDGRQVSYAVAAWRTACTDGTGSDTEEFENIPLSAGGKFAKSYDTGDYQDGTATVRFAGSIDGKLNKRRSKITGTVRVMFSVKDPVNGVDYACDTGTVKYTAIN